MPDHRSPARTHAAAGPRAVAGVDPNAVIAVIGDAEKLVGWKQLTVPQRVGAIATLVAALGGLATAIATAVS